MITALKSQHSKALNIALWIAQGGLAGMFLMAGYLKSFTPIDHLSTIMPLAGEAPLLIRFIGISELLGGVGVILPSVLRIKPHLAVWAALAFALIMILAIAFHVNRGEFSALGTNFILLAVALFVAWGRGMKVTIRPRNENAVLTR